MKMYLCLLIITRSEMNFKSKVKAIYKGIVFSLSASNSLIFTIFYNIFYKPEKGSLDDFTSRFSRLTGKVTVIQIGANDGINNDPIHKFIKRDHWQGVLLEPQKFVFEKYLKPLYRKTKGITVMNAALDTLDGSKPIYKIAVSNSRWATGLTSFNRKILEEAVRSGYIERQTKKEGCPLPENKDDYIAEESVECICTETLLKKAGIEKTDWLQIDTEGFDFEIIKMFNIGTTNPTVIVYENLHLSSDQREECINHLKTNHYVVRDYGANTLAMRNPPEILKRFFYQN
jgi:FkbM family methyltransferase